METRESKPLERVAQVLAKLLFIVVLIAGIVGISVAAALSPMIIMSAYGADADWVEVANIGQAYGAASAMLASLALGVVSASLWMQRSQIKHDQKAILRQSTRDIVTVAMHQPKFGQCWGARFAPDHVDESLFFYTSSVVNLWSHAWEDRLLTEEQARSFMRQFFGSEVPRMFWERHGDWHHPRRTLNRTDRFIALMNEEYLRAVKAGPPTRLYETLDGSDSSNANTLRERREGRAAV
jgi:hypothetical protein